MNIHDPHELALSAFKAEADATRELERENERLRAALNEALRLRSEDTARLSADKRALAYAANDLGGIVEAITHELGVNRDAGIDVIIPAIRKLRDPS